jgi:hypothetical protein
MKTTLLTRRLLIDTNSEQSILFGKCCFNATPVSKFKFDGRELKEKEGYLKRFYHKHSILKDSFSNWDFKTEECNRLGYLVSSTIYTEATIANLLANVTYVTVSDSVDSLLNKVSSGNFVFNRTNKTQVLYLVWDYTNRNCLE